MVMTFIVSAAAFVMMSMANASGLTPQHEVIWDSARKAWMSADDLASSINPGDVVVMGEQHATGQNKDQIGVRIHHQNQVRLLELLKARTLPVSVGMEFFDYTAQTSVNQYLAGSLSEQDFLKAVSWGGNAFSLYREQVLAPRGSGVTIALNIPRAISSKVGKSGPQSLTNEEMAFLPPLWERGSAEYFARFSEIMNGHVTEAQLENFFWAQSLWDDTMAWNISRHRAAASHDALLVIVGEFHVEYGHGLPARLGRHGVSAGVRTLLQVEVSDLSEASLNAAVAAHPTYGPRADFIWVYLP